MQRVFAVVARATVAFLFTAFIPTIANGQIVSTWRGSPGSSDWFNASNWDNGVPNAPGDVARVNSRVSSTPRLDQSVTLGELELFGGRGLTIPGAGSWNFDRPGVDPAEIRTILPAGATPVQNTLVGPIAISPGQTLNVDLPPATTLILKGGLLAGAGALTKTNAGILDLTAGSPAWDGLLTVNAGNVAVRNNSSLGSSIGATTVNPGGSVTLYTSGPWAEPFMLNGGTLSTTGGSGGEPTLNGPIDLQSTSTIVVGGVLVLNSTISGPGGLDYVSNSSSGAFVFGDNSFGGVTTISQGRVSARHANALGSPNQGTIIKQGGELNLQFTTAEPLTLQGGSVGLASTVSATGLVTIESGLLKLPDHGTFTTPVVLTGLDTSKLRGSYSLFTGGVSGTGDLYLDGWVTIGGNPLAQDGGFYVYSNSYTSNAVTLNSANTYTGPTKISGGSLIVNHPDALGTAITPIEVSDDGRLELNEVVQREIILHNGSLFISREDQPLERDIHISSGAIRGNGVYNGQIHLEGSYLNPRFISGTFNGVISGDSGADFGYRQESGFGSESVTLNENNTYTGLTNILGILHMNAPGALGTSDVGTIVGLDAVLNVNVVTEERILVTPNGRVNLNVQLERLPRLAQTGSLTLNRGRQTVAVNVPSVYHQHYDVNEGVLEINDNTVIDSLTVRNGGRIDVKGGTLSTAADVELQKGEIAGRIAGTGAIRKITNEYGKLSHLPDFDGEVVVEKGVLQIDSDDALGTAAGPTRVGGSRDAVLQIHGTPTIRDDVYLNNANGIDNTGGIYLVTNGATLLGRLDLGTVGSTIGAGDCSSCAGSAQLNLEGPISGGSLTTEGRHAVVRIMNSANTYSGATNVRGGRIELSGNGTLTSSSAIVLYEDSGSSKGTVVIDNSTVSRADRIDDSVPIHMRGGEIRFENPTTGTSSETLGRVAILEGNSEFDVGTARLTINEFDRQGGATARIDFGTGRTTLADANPQLVGGVLPWLVVNDGVIPGIAMATVSNGQIRQLSTYTQLAAAAALDNVLVSAASTLGSDKDVNSITFVNSASLDLGGHRLRVNSGGTLAELGYTIANGQLTAGVAGDHELIIRSGQIDAQIVDDDDAPVSVTVTGGARFSKANSYSGTTFVNDGTLSLMSHESLPDGGDIEIVGGIVEFDFATMALKHVGNIRLAADGQLIRKGNGSFSFNELQLEDGTFAPGSLVGSGPIYKSSGGSAAISASSTSEYQGDVIVEEGVLTLSGLPQANLVVQGGTLSVGSAPNDITLAGGALDFLYLKGTIHVDGPSRLMAQPRYNASNYGIAGSFVGSGDLTFDNRPSPGDSSNVNYQRAADSIAYISGHSPLFSGDVAIRTAVVVVRNADGLGSGDITVYSGGELQLTRSVENFIWNNDVRLEGGQISGVRGDTYTPLIAGDLFVSGNSFIGGQLWLLGDVHLADHTRLTTTRGYETRFLGDTYIGGTVEMHITRTVNDVALDNRNVIQLGGRIVSDAPQAVLKLFNSRIDHFLFDASFHVQAGQSLQILEDDAPITINLNSRTTLSGNGTFLNPVHLKGGVLAPGQSPGVLSFADDLSVGEGTIYEWEINNAAGNAGEPSGWDLIDVAQQLAFEASPELPWILRVTGLDGINQPGTVPNFDSYGNYRWLIASAGSIVGFDPLAVHIEFSESQSANPTFRRPNFSFEIGGNDLYLVYEYRVPEPRSAALLGVASMALLCTGCRKTAKAMEMQFS